MLTDGEYIALVVGGYLFVSLITTMRCLSWGQRKKDKTMRQIYGWMALFGIAWPLVLVLAIVGFFVSLVIDTRALMRGDDA